MRLVAVAAVLALTACTARMRVPEGFSEQAEALTVSGRDASEPTASFELRFGKYRVHEIAQGWTTGFAERQYFGSNVVDLQGYPQKDSYSFVLEGDHGPTRAICTEASEAVSVAVEVDVTVDADTRALSCICANLDAKLASRVQLRADEATFMGTLAVADARYQVRGSRLLAGRSEKSSHASGYVFSTAAGPAAAVDVLHEGAVWFEHGLPATQRDALACAAVALLLYPDPEHRGK